MAIIGAHMLFYSSEAEAAREVLGDILGTKSVDAGGGWPIYAMPPSEIAVHPSDGATNHEITLMCDDLAATMADLSANGVEFKGDVVEERFGLVATMVLPGGVEMLLYEPFHPKAID